MNAMFGCASFPGIDPRQHALALSFLYQTSLVRDEWMVSARPDLYRNMDLFAPEEISPRQALSAMPPLVKGYLRLGAMIGDGAVVDQAFNTTDVLIVLPVAVISGRYTNHFGTDFSRFAS
jgi:putative hemolysin